jgi:GR25 family glycosyltransferase involved in LPS biosynthesis
VKAVYINLDSALERRAEIEKSFEKTRKPGWSLLRQSAVRVADSNYIGPRLRRTGSSLTLSPAEEGCYLSHRAVIDLYAGRDAPVLVLEDDALFAAHSFEIIDGFLNSKEAEAWDLIFTDVIIPNADGMLSLFKLKNSLTERALRVIDLATLPFAGATAYVVKPGIASKLVAWLSDPDFESMPYDMAIRKLIYKRRLRACVLFPFPTSVNAYANRSQIQDQNASTADILWNTFRQMVWIGANPIDLQETLKNIDELYVDEDSRTLGTILSALASRSYVPK